MKAIDAYHNLIENAEMARYDVEFCVEPFIMSGLKLSFADFYPFSLYLVYDDDLYKLWIVRDNIYIERRLFSLQEDEYLNDWAETMLSNQRVKEFEYQFNHIIEKGANYLDEEMKNEGIMKTLSLVLGDEPMESYLRLPKSCAISIYGQVFHGIRGLDEYCRIQKDSSSPYILKKCHSEIISDYEYRCYNYLICKTKEEAESWIRPFISIGNVSATNPDRFYSFDGFPPLISYTERYEFFVLSYMR